MAQSYCAKFDRLIRHPRHLTATINCLVNLSHKENGKLVSGHVKLLFNNNCNTPPKCISACFTYWPCCQYADHNGYAANLIALQHYAPSDTKYPFHILQASEQATEKPSNNDDTKPPPPPRGQQIFTKESENQLRGPSILLFTGTGGCFPPTGWGVGRGGKVTD